MTYPNMAELLQDRKLGDWTLDHFTIYENDITARLQGISLDTYIRLVHGGTVMMSNTNMEQETNEEFCKRAYGDILIAGLGMGMIVMAIQDKPNVKSITIIEKSHEVIEMVSTQLCLNDKVKIVCADIFEWEPTKRYDVIYLDIWPVISRRIYASEMMPLKRKFRNYLKPKKLSPDRFCKCWAENFAKNGKPL